MQSLKSAVPRHNKSVDDLNYSQYNSKKSFPEVSKPNNQYSVSIPLRYYTLERDYPQYEYYCYCHHCNALL
jgi:hypothetical protein